MKMRRQGEPSLLGKIFIVFIISSISGFIIWEIAGATSGAVSNVLLWIGAIVFIPAFLFILFLIGCAAGSFFESAASFLPSPSKCFSDELPEFHGFFDRLDFFIPVIALIVVGAIIAVLAVLAILGLLFFIHIVN